MPLIKIYKVLVLAFGTLVPLAAIGYLSLFIDPKIKFDSSIAHEIAISFATLTLVFVTVIAYRSYQRTGNPFLRFLTLAVLGFVILDLLLFFLVSSSIGVGAFHLRIIESVSLAFFGLSALLTLFLRPTAPWMPYHLVALLIFMQAAVAFLLARPWNHMWWLAHASSAAGFFILGYEVIRVYEKKPEGISA